MSPTLATKPFSEVSRRFTALTPLREGAVDKGARTARCIIITEGLGNLRDRNFYSDSAVKSCVEIFNGKQFYIDHPSAHEEDDRPERSIRDLAGYFYDTQLGSVRDPDTGEELSACFASLRFDESASGQFALDKVATALEYQQRFPNSKDVYAGISINGGGVSHEGTIRGMSVNVVTEIQEGFSADIVTKPARGGRFLSMLNEAARAAEWKRRTARESRTPTRTSGEKRRPVMAVVKEVKKGASGSKAKESKLSLLKPITSAFKAFHEAEKARKPRTALKHLGEALSLVGKNIAKLKEGQAMANEEEVKGLLRKMRAAMNDGGDPMTILQDVQSDLGQLEKSLSGGGGKPQAEDEGQAEHMAAEKEKEGEEADETETEGEVAAEGEGEKEKAAEGEGEGEEEADAEAEGATAETENETENEGEEAFGDDDTGDDEEEPTDDDAGEYGMGDDDEEQAEGEDEAEGQAMQYKCAKCGEVNQVMPPKGFKLSKMEMGYASESDRGTSDERALRETIGRLKARIANKEARFMKNGKELAKLVRENVRLRAENQALKLVREARKLLKEAGVSPKILSPHDLVNSFERHQWPYEIKRALRTMESETRLLNGGHGPRGGGAGTNREANVDDEALLSFRESYKKHSGQSQTEDD